MRAFKKQGLAAGRLGMHLATGLHLSEITAAIHKSWFQTTISAVRFFVPALFLNNTTCHALIYPKRRGMCVYCFFSKL